MFMEGAMNIISVSAEVAPWSKQVDWEMCVVHCLVRYVLEVIA